MAYNYIKFQRGSQEAYNALLQAGQLDNDTLYFIYAADGASTGSLYMGAKLISGGDTVVTSNSLDDLIDVIVTNAATNSFLVKDNSGNWVAKTLEDVVALIKDNFGDIASSAQVFQVVLEENETDEQAINRIVADTLVSSGDIIVVKKLIADEKYQHTAYVFDGQNWAAMDGNYDATNVYFNSDLTITADIGVQEIDETGSKVLDTTGKSLKQVLDMILASRKLPTKVNPSVSVTSNEDKSYEVGTNVEVSYEAVLDPGSYIYGPNTNITAKSWSVTLGDETLTTASGTFTSFVVTDTTNSKISATAIYDIGAAPKDNLGEVITDANELAECQIQAGNKIGYANAITGYRNAFYGSKTDAIELNSNNIRTLNNVKASSDSLTINVVANAKQVIIALPEGRKVTKVVDEAAFGTDIFEKFTTTIVSVGGADATADNIGNYAKNYNVYIYNPSTALGANTYKVTVVNE